MLYSWVGPRRLVAIGRSDTAVGPHEFEIEIFLNYLVRDYSLARHLPPFLRFVGVSNDARQHSD